MFDPPRKQGTIGMKNQMLLTIRKRSTILYQPSPLDTLGNWLIDSDASRHFNGYKEALSNMIEKETNLETIHGDDATYLLKGVQKVTLQLN